MGSSGGGDTKTTTQNLTPQQQQLADLAMPGYQQFAASNPTLPGGDKAVAGFDPLQTAGQEAVLGSVGQAGDTTTGANKANQYYTSGALLDPGSDPNVQNAVKAATNPIFNNLRDVTLPGLAADASTSGSGGVSANFGSSRQGIAEGLATRGANEAAGNAGANILNTARGQGISAELQAIGQSPQIAASSTIPGTITSTVGDVRQGQAQAKLDADNAASQFAQFLPLLKAQLLTQGAGAIPGGSTTSVGTSNQDANPISQLIGGASAAGGLAGGLSKLLPLFML